ncbi:hypothetical protein PENTCL1PPCAC_5442, partial [Pristionchus entomophagus]
LPIFVSFFQSLPDEGFLRIEQLETLSITADWRTRVPGYVIHVQVDAGWTNDDSAHSAAGRLVVGAAAGWSAFGFGRGVTSCDRSGDLHPSYSLDRRGRGTVFGGAIGRRFRVLVHLLLDASSGRTRLLVVRPIHVINEGETGDIGGIGVGEGSRVVEGRKDETGL